jgi:hypothetical protein
MLETINPQEFGIEPSKAAELVSNLPQIKSERDLLSAQYDEVVKMDIENPQTAAKAKSLRLLIRDNRTKGIEVWHTNAKNFFLRGGQFVDAIKRQECDVNKRMEETLEQIEKHQEHLEAARKEVLRTQRSEQLELYSEFVPFGVDLGAMPEEEFTKLLKGAKLQFEADQAEKKAAEAARIEAERIERVRQENRIALMPYSHWIENYDALDLAEVTAEKGAQLIADAKAAKQKEADEKAKAEAEAAELRKQAEAREAEIEKERKAAEAKAKKERDEMQAKLDAERKAREKQEAEIEAARKQAEAEAKAKADSERKAKNAPEKEKLVAFAKKLKDIERPEVSTAEAKAIIDAVNVLIEKTVNYLNEKAQTL